MSNSADAAASPLEPVIGLTGIAALEAEMRDRLAAKNAEIERLGAINDERAAIATDLAGANIQLRDINAELLAALEGLIKDDIGAWHRAHVAIAKAKGETP